MAVVSLSMARLARRSALLASGPWPGMIFTSAGTIASTFSIAAM